MSLLKKSYAAFVCSSDSESETNFSQEKFMTELLLKKCHPKDKKSTSDQVMLRSKSTPIVTGRNIKEASNFIARSRSCKNKVTIICFLKYFVFISRIMRPQTIKLFKK